jgi:hypothetical protein
MGTRHWCDDFSDNWLRVLDTAERSQVDQRIRQQLHAIVPLLDTFKTEQQPLEFVLPRKGALDAQASRMNRCVEEPLAPALGALAIAGILGDVRDQARIENALPIVRRIKAAIEVEGGTSKVQPNLFGDLLQGVESLRQQDQVGLVDGSHGEGS